VLLANAAALLATHAFQITDTMVATACGTAPSLNLASLDAYNAHHHCKMTAETCYLMMLAVLTSAGGGYAIRVRQRRKAQRDEIRDAHLNAEMARIRADLERRA